MITLNTTFFTNSKITIRTFILTFILTLITSIVPFCISIITLFFKSYYCISTNSFTFVCVFRKLKSSLTYFTNSIYTYTACFITLIKTIITTVIRCIIPIITLFHSSLYFITTLCFTFMCSKINIIS